MTCLTDHGNFCHKISRRKISPLVCFLLILATAICHATDQKLSFQFDADTNLIFDTGVVKGHLQKEGSGDGLKQVIFENSDVRIDGNRGLLVPYRFLTAQKRYGLGSWEWQRTGLVLSNGNAELRWAGVAARPFNFCAVYSWKTNDTLDFTVFFTPQGDLPQFELFLACYFQNFTRAMVFAQDAGNGKRGFAEAMKARGEMQLFPRGQDVLPMINDGRWNYPPYPNHWAIRTNFASPLGIRTDPKSGVSVLMMSPPGECFAVSMSQQESPLGANYLSLFGKDARDGQTLTAHVRLVFATNVNESLALQKFKEYIGDAKSRRDDQLMTKDELQSLRDFLAAPIALSLPMANRSSINDITNALGTVPEVTPELPKPGPGGWIKLFDGKQLYGCQPSVTNAGAEKICVQDGCLRLDSYGINFDLKRQDVVIRARLKKITGQNSEVSVRCGTNDQLCDATFNGTNSFVIGKNVDHKYKNLTTGRSQDPYTGFVQLELRAEDLYLSLYADGDKICEANDPSMISGTIGVQAVKGITLFESIEARLPGRQ